MTHCKCIHFRIVLAEVLAVLVVGRGVVICNYISIKFKTLSVGLYTHSNCTGYIAPPPSPSTHAHLNAAAQLMHFFRTVANTIIRIGYSYIISNLHYSKSERKIE